MTGEIRLTRVAKHGGALLCKRIVADENGSPVSDGSPCAMARGTAMRVRLNGSPASDLVDQIMDLGSHEALVLGDLASGLPDEIQLEKDELAGSARGTHGRTRRTFAYRPGQPAAALLDYDQKGMPADVRQRLEAVGGFEEALATLVPGYPELERVVRASTSAGVYNAKTGEHFPGSGGLHVYVFAQDGSDIPRFLVDLHKRAWLAGYGWILIGARGQMLVRSVFDYSVGLPERLVFEGQPLVVAPLAQDHAARQPTAHEGDPLDTRAACPPLTAEEQRQFNDLVAAAKRAAKPEAEAAVEKAAEKISQERGLDIDTAREVIAASLRGDLTSLDVLHFDDDGNGAVRVADVLADPERFHGQTLADPLEGRGYGRGKAKVYRNSNGSVVINSFAHGGIVYRLGHDAAYIEAQLVQAGEGAPFVLAGLMVHARGLDPVTRERLRGLAAKLGKVSKTAIKEIIEEKIGNARRDAIEAGKARRAAERADAAGNPEDDSDEGAAAEARAEAAADNYWEERLDAGIDELNGPYFVAAMGGSVRVASVVPDPAQENRERLTFSRAEDIRLLFAHRHYKTGVSQKGYDVWKGLGEAWLEHPRRRTYSQIALIPDGPCPADTCNLWRGFGVGPKAGDWSTVQDHLWSVICSRNQTNYDWLIGWLAYCVQHPGKQAEAAVVLRGLKGTGKGMVGQILIRIFRNHSLHITHSKHLVGHFNAHLVDALFLFVDEAFWAGDKQGEGTLKALITERMVMIEPKGIDSFQMRNRLKILMASNNDWVVPASADERRYFVLDVPDTRKSDKAYFTKLAAAIEGDELAAFLDYLLNLDLSEFDHRNPPHTDGLNKQKLIGAESFIRYWYDCLAAGYLLNTGEDNWPEDVVCQVLHAGYVDHAHQHGDRHPLTINQIGVKLRQLSPDKFRTSRPQKPWNGIERPSRYALQSLDEHKAAFLEAMKIDAASHEWPEEE